MHNLRGIFSADDVDFIPIILYEFYNPAVLVLKFEFYFDFAAFVNVDDIYQVNK